MTKWIKNLTGFWLGSLKKHEKRHTDESVCLFYFVYYYSGVFWHVFLNDIREKNEAPRSKLRGIKAELRRSYSNVK